MFPLDHTHKSYSTELKAYVTKMVVKDGHKMTDLSRELDIPYANIKRWVREYRKKQDQAEKDSQNQLLTASEYKDMYEKERQRKLDLEEENDILKKAMHIFTQEKE